MLRRREQTPMWKYYLSNQGIWYWFSPKLPNGWYACICDDSQQHEPPRKTTYQIFAAADYEGQPGGEILTLNQVSGDPCDTFEAAKLAAMDLALAQPNLEKNRRNRARSPESDFGRQ